MTFYATSDERLKDNITPIDDPLAKVISISGNTFDWNENTNNEGSDTGVIAQEIEALGLPGLVQREIMDTKQSVMKNLFLYNL